MGIAGTYGWQSKSLLPVAPANTRDSRQRGGNNEKDDTSRT